MNISVSLKDNSDLRIGIWGLGIVGRSAISFLHARGHRLGLCESRTLTLEEQAFLEHHKVKVYQQQEQLESFLADHEIIIPSGGIDLAPFVAHAHKWLPELDLFQAFSTTPIIAVTGTLGKTTVTHSISQLLQRAGKRVLIGGNIGIGLCDLIDQQHLVDFVVLEVSSFQLEYCRSFAPRYALLTNVYPNHLDRHGTMQAYIEAKMRIFAQQQQDSVAIIAADIVADCAIIAHNAKLIAVGTPQSSMTSDYVIVCGDAIVHSINGVTKEIAQLPAYGFAANWLSVAALFDELQLPMLTEQPIERSSVLAHRIEKVATIQGRDIYNDSKATIMQAVIGACEQFKDKRVHLLLGGLSKGVDRAPFIAQLPSCVVRIYAFGTEQEKLVSAAQAAGKVASGYQDLIEAYAAAFEQSGPEDVILLSPGGSSFDLFKNYQERGSIFTHLVHEHEQRLLHPSTLEANTPEHLS